MADFYNHIPAGCTIGHVTATGYGEALLIEALKADSGEIAPLRTCAAPRRSCPASSLFWTLAART